MEGAESHRRVIAGGDKRAMEESYSTVIGRGLLGNLIEATNLIDCSHSMYGVQYGDELPGLAGLTKT